MAALTEVETETKYVSTFLAAIQSLRQHDLFTDISIECGKRSFAAHRVVLHSASLYFRELLDKESPDKHLKKVELKGIDCDAVDSVLNFIYTGKIDPLINEDGSELKAKLAAAHLLQVTDLYEYYWNKFKDGLTVDSYIDFWKTTIHLQAASSANEFLELTIHQLKEILGQPEIKNFIADGVVKSCLKWIKHKPEERKCELMPLFSFIDFNRLSNPFLGDIVNSEPLITECPNLFDVLISVAMNRMVTTDDQPSTEKSYFVCCGKLDGHTVISMYDFEDKIWLPTKVLALPLTPGTAVTSYNGALYFIGGGESADDATDCLFRYCPVSNAVTTLSNLLTPTYYAGAGVLKDKFYLVGGLHGNKETNCVECYNPLLDEWVSVAPTVKAHSQTNVVALRDNLYVVGSYKCSVVETYNSMTNQWSEVTSIPQLLGDGTPRATVHMERLWVLRDSLEEKFHIYDPPTDQWVEKDFEGGPDKVNGLWSSQYNQKKLFPLVVLDYLSHSYYLYHDETSTWELLPLPETEKACYYWQFLIFND